MKLRDVKVGDWFKIIGEFHHHFNRRLETHDKVAKVISAGGTWWPVKDMVYIYNDTWNSVDWLMGDCDIDLVIVEVAKLRTAKRWAKALRMGYKWARCPVCLGRGYTTESDANDVTKDGMQRVYKIKCTHCDRGGG